jgi:cyanophycinase
MKVSSFALLVLVLWTTSASAEAPLSVAAPPRGTLFIAGGGLLGDDVMSPFLKLIGGDEGRLVVITTANWRAEQAPDEIVALWTARTRAAITLLHARSADEANSEAFVAPLKQATGVWLMSGRQSRLTAAYLGTRLLKELRGYLDRGGVIGGSSAGAAVMTDVMLSGGTLQQPGIYEGFGLLPGSIVDQHFLMRKREPRLLCAMEKNPGRVGFGIDEGTALIVHGRDVQVVGQSTVSVFLSACASRPLVSKLLKAGDREDLTALCRAAAARCCEPFPTAKPQAPVVEKGSLVIVGGGRMPPEVQSKFIDLAGGPTAKIVVVPSADERATTDVGDVRWLEKAGAKNVEVVHPKNRDEANSDEFVAKLRDAAGVWFGGGRQWRLVDAFEGTKTYEAFHDVLARGGVIGGSSAGATIQGDYLVRGSPLGNTVMMAEGYERGFGFLGGTAIDQHFTQRKRQPDMESLKRTFPQLLGLGLDEGTAVVVRGTKLEVLGDATVSIYPPAVAPTVRPVSAQPAEPAAAIPQVLKSGDAYDLRAFRTLQSAE